MILKTIALVFLLLTEVMYPVHTSAPIYVYNNDWDVFSIEPGEWVEIIPKEYIPPNIFCDQVPDGKFCIGNYLTMYEI